MLCFVIINSVLFNLLCVNDCHSSFLYATLTEKVAPLYFCVVAFAAFEASGFKDVFSTFLATCNRTCFLLTSKQTIPKGTEKGIGRQVRTKATGFK